MAKKPPVPCPKCKSGETGVISTYPVATSQDVVRRRVCRDCDHRWYTIQHPEKALQMYQLVFERQFQKNVCVKEVRL